MLDEKNSHDILDEQLARVDNDPSVYARTEELDLELEKRKKIIELELLERRKAQEDLENEINSQILAIKEYLAVRLWRQALTKLKFLYDSPNVPRSKRPEVKKLYMEAHSLMEEARQSDPSVPMFSHFNLPTNDVM